MRCGFAVLEAGFLPEQGVANILFKNITDSLVGVLGFFILGYAFAFGGEFGSGGTGTVLGSTGFCMYGINPCEYPFITFQYSFAATSVTIISGALGNRSSFATYFTYSFLFMAFIYPLPAHWAWSKDGWLRSGHNGVGYTDFAGAGVVHMVGGAAGLVGAIVAGPRYERTLNHGFARSPPHSVPLIAVGLFVLYFGFLFFNGATALTYTVGTNVDEAAAVGLAMFNTTLAAATGGLTIILRQKYKGKSLSVGSTTNGAIAGMVAVAGCAGFIQPWASLLVGILAAFSFLAFSALLVKYRVDDAIDASSAHLAPGIAGLLSGPWLFYQHVIVYNPSVEAFERFGWNILGCIVLLLWTVALSFALFASLKMGGLLTVSPFADRYGVDRFEHQEIAYDMSGQSNSITGSRRASPTASRTFKDRKEVVV